LQCKINEYNSLLNRVFKNIIREFGGSRIKLKYFMLYFGEKRFVASPLEERSRQRGEICERI